MVWSAEKLEAIMPDTSQLLSDEPEMESSIHYMQLLMLVTCLEWLWRDNKDFFIGANLTIYFSRQQLRNRDFRGPDLFVVKGTQKRPRNSWVVWEEDGRYPDLIVELLSDSTATTDRTVKKTLYQDRFRTPEYFWFSPENLEFEGFRLRENEYEAIAPNERGWRWSKVLGLYLGVEANQLRYFTPEGEKVPTPEEAAQQEQRRAEQEQRRAEQAELELGQERQENQRLQVKAEQLAEQLRSLGFKPENLA
ncbi:MAG: Uma2 family endonuclease [Gloeocapsa sp. UFS-A4-WI-NPMV-4B04]|jgi:Uma2 family endonuclease|nr:Uma2 family endonuclease [Gloeocapsa sp. UFS-A4-WI-NPMV-4B04]